MVLSEQEVQGCLKIHVFNDFSGHRFSWSPDHIRDFENPTFTIPTAYFIIVYFSEELHCEETDCVRGSRKRFLLKSAIAKCEDMKRQRAKYRAEQGEV
ncbi:MAG TPA: hypothetical protein VEC97_05365 [Candidatus Acidoferrales bacterium]|nr:hypothetical protein [Candidatus Acidoferrales bacterium]